MILGDWMIVVIAVMFVVAATGFIKPSAGSGEPAPPFGCLFWIIIIAGIVVVESLIIFRLVTT